MTYDTPHMHLTFGGSFFQSETWSCGLRIAPEAGGAGAFPAPADAQAFAEAKIVEVTDKVKAYWAALAANVNGQARLEWVKFNPVDTNGRQYPAYNTVVQNFTAIPGGSSFSQFPQIAIVVSLMTGLARGRAHTGRWYLPFGGGSPVDTFGNVTAAVASAVADPSAAFINSINDYAGVEPAWGANVHVMSNVGAGTRRKVTGVRVGRTIDTQRRRRSQIPELYVASTVAIT